MGAALGCRLRAHHHGGSHLRDVFNSSLLAAFDALAARHGLTFARYEALVLLAFSREGQLSMSRIGERLMVHPTSATNIVHAAASGFVERLPYPADGRGPSRGSPLLGWPRWRR